MKTTNHFCPQCYHVSNATCSTGRYEGGRVDGLVSGCRYVGWNSNCPYCGKKHGINSIHQLTRICSGQFKPF